MAQDTGSDVVDDVSLLVLVVEANPFFWSARTKGKSTSKVAPTSTSLADFFDQLAVFVNAFQFLHSQNSLAVIANGIQTCKFIHRRTAGYRASHENQASSARGQAPMQPTGSESSAAAIAQEMGAFAEEEAALLLHGNADVAPDSNLLSGSLSMALTYIMKSMQGPPPRPGARILCLQGSSDSSQQYVAVMNAIFSAQRSNVPVDSCILGHNDSAFLQQAAYLTGGVYIKPQRPEGFLQYLTMTFAADLHSRRFLHLPRPSSVDFRASCFCHKKAIDIGFVCSVCLSIYCKHSKTCATCGATFASGRRGAAAQAPGTERKT